jgi:hypothetical protein
MQKELLQQQSVETIGQQISFEAGEEMVKNFFDKNADQAHATFVGREMIEALLAQPNCSGIALLPAYNAEGTQQSVLVGVDEIGNPILNFNTVNANGQLIANEGSVIVSQKGIGGELAVGW